MPLHVQCICVCVCVCVCMFVCVISNQHEQKPHMSDHSELDAMLHKTCLSGTAQVVHQKCCIHQFSETNKTTKRKEQWGWRLEAPGKRGGGRGSTIFEKGW